MSRYIGARYVIKIYENSLDHSSTAWEAGVNYEPFTLVTFNNGSYLSKNEVPSSVGDPATNPDYWAQTGFYNGQIAALTNRVDALEVEALEIPKKDYIALDDMSITRYDYGTYTIDVLKINYLKNDGVSKNIPIIRGANTLHNMQEYVKDCKAGCNIGYYDTANNQSVCSMLSEGVQHIGDVLNDSNTSYLAIADDGSLKEYDYTTSIATIAADGYNNAAGVRCQIIANGSEVSPNPVAARFMQQLFGIDYDNNYYIITTSYFCNLTGTQQAAWVISTIPTIKDVFVLDSGGSAQTYAAGRRTNLESDITADGLGREVAGALVFPVDENSSDINTLANLFLNNDNLRSKCLVRTGTTDITVGANVLAANIAVYQIGNLVFGKMIVTAQAGYDGSWTQLTYFDSKIPKPDHQMVVNSVTPHSQTPYTADLRLTNDNIQTVTDAKLEFRAPAAASDMYYNFDFWYVTKQNM